VSTLGFSADRTDKQQASIRGRTEMIRRQTPSTVMLEHERRPATLVHAHAAIAVG
jgi:hypothetical protein